MSERRSKRRVEISLEGRWDGSSSRRNIRVADLSEEGCYLDTIADTAVGEVFILTLLLPDNELLSLKCEVAHHTPRLGFGVRFIDLHQNQRERLRSLLGNGLQRNSEQDSPSSSAIQVDLTNRQVM